LNWSLIACAEAWRGPSGVVIENCGSIGPSCECTPMRISSAPQGQSWWDDLIYTGRGKLGNQQRDDARNLDVAENRRPLFVFEAAGPRRLRFRGRAVNVEERTGRAPDDEGAMRDVLLFRLRFDSSLAATPPTAALDGGSAAGPGREARPFRDEPPAPPCGPSGEVPDPEIVAAKREQANQDHHAIVRALNALLQAVACADITEIPGAIDLWATRSDGSRMIFEAKTISASNEVPQTRNAFAQLHEYRMEYGTPDDDLCLVVNRPLSVRRQKMLDALGIAVLVNSGADFQAGNDHGSHLIDALTEPGA
jgi:hypothetical protein